MHRELLFRWLQGEGIDPIIAGLAADAIVAPHAGLPASTPAQLVIETDLAAAGVADAAVRTALAIRIHAGEPWAPPAPATPAPATGTTTTTAAPAATVVTPPAPTVVTPTPTASGTTAPSSATASPTIIFMPPHPTAPPPAATADPDDGEDDEEERETDTATLRLRFRPELRNAGPNGEVSVPFELNMGSRTGDPRRVNGMSENAWNTVRTIGMLLIGGAILIVVLMMVKDWYLASRSTSAPAANPLASLPTGAPIVNAPLPDKCSDIVDAANHRTDLSPDAQVKLRMELLARISNGQITCLR